MDQMSPTYFVAHSSLAYAHVRDIQTSADNFIDIKSACSRGKAYARMRFHKTGTEKDL